MAEKDQLLRERELLCQNLTVRLPSRCERGSQAVAVEPARGAVDRPPTTSVAVMARGSFQTAYQKLRQRATELMVSDGWGLAGLARNKEVSRVW